MRGFDGVVPCHGAAGAKRWFWGAVLGLESPSYGSCCGDDRVAFSGASVRWTDLP